VIEFRILGAIDLRAEAKGRVLREVLAQPKRLAVLAYLAVEGRGGPLSRDSLLALFWPESPDERARNSLNQAVFALRKALGPPAVRTEASDAVGIDHGQVWCDAVAFEEALATGDRSRAIELYGGELLAGFHLSEAVEFSQWLDGARRRLRTSAVEAALGQAEFESAANPVEAIRLLRLAQGWDPVDERVHRQLITLLDVVGDRAGAMREYEQFRDRLDTELGLEPTPEITTLMDAIRQRAEAREVGEMPVTFAPQVAPLAREEPPRPRPRHRAIIASFSLLVAVAASLYGWSRTRSPVPSLVADRVMVAAFENRTGDRTLDPVGFMAGDWIAQGLARSGLVRVIPFSTVLRETSSPDGPGGLVPTQLARSVGAGLLISGAFYNRGDSLVFQGHITRVATGEVLRALPEIAAPRAEPEQAVTQLGQRSRGALAALTDERLASWADPGSQPPSLDSYRLFAEGMDRFLLASRRQRVDGLNEESRRLNKEAADLFLAAAGTDSGFSAPLFWAAFARGNGGDSASASGLLHALERRGGLSGWERAVLRFALASERKDWDATYVAAQDLVDRSPDSEWLFTLGSSAYYARRFDAALAAFERLDPDRGWMRGWGPYWRMRILTRHVLGDHERELDDVRQLRARFPDDPNTPRLELLALAGAGRSAELLQRVTQALADRDTTIARWLAWTAQDARAHGDSATALRLAAAGIEFFDSFPESARTPDWEVTKARLLDAAHDWNRSHDAWSRLATRYPDTMEYQARLGVVAARRGARAEAERALTLLERFDPSEFDLNGGRLVWQARIAAQLGMRERAVALLREARDLGFSYSDDVYHTIEDLEPLRDYEPYRALMRWRR